jgi:spermidine/putrescine transport system permease protein
MSRFGKGAVKSRRARFGSLALNAYAGLALFYIFLPIFVVVLFSFNKPNGKYNIRWQSFTLDNWANPFAEKALTEALLVSLRIAVASTLIATVLGALMAISLSKYKFRGGTVVDLFLVLPLTSPEVVLGSSLATLFINNDVDFGYPTVIIAHVMFQISFVALTVRARIRGFDWTLEQAAMDLGASPLAAFRKVTLPLIAPGIAAAAMLSFALSIDDFIITYFNAGSLLTFPLQIFGEQQRKIPPQINVLATMILIVSVSLLVVGTLAGNRRRRRLEA